MKNQQLAEHLDLMNRINTYSSFFNYTRNISTVQFMISRSQGPRFPIFDFCRFQVDRPPRRRGSSGEWRHDRLSREEICADLSTAAAAATTPTPSKTMVRACQSIFQVKIIWRAKGFDELQQNPVTLDLVGQLVVIVLIPLAHPRCLQAQDWAA